LEFGTQLLGVSEYRPFRDLRSVPEARKEKNEKQESEN
jgi:hypothetical protein